MTWLSVPSSTCGLYLAAMLPPIAARGSAVSLLWNLLYIDVNANNYITTLLIQSANENNRAGDTLTILKHILLRFN
jgi:hypothetical protein